MVDGGWINKVWTDSYSKWPAGQLKKKDTCTFVFANPSDVLPELYRSSCNLTYFFSLNRKFTS